MRYWVQGLGDGGDPVASSGDPKRPFAVSIKDEISTEPPHLPGKKAPQACGDNDCPPGLRQGDVGNPPRTRANVAGIEGEPGRVGYPAGTATCARLWVGASLAVDFLSVPAGDDLCKLSPSAGASEHRELLLHEPRRLRLSLSQSSGTDTELEHHARPKTRGAFRWRGGPRQRARSCCRSDYALSPNLLAMAFRLGYVFNGYTGNAAVTDGRALGVARAISRRAEHVSCLARKPLTHEGFAPDGFRRTRSLRVRSPVDVVRVLAKRRVEARNHLAHRCAVLRDARSRCALSVFAARGIHGCAAGQRGYPEGTAFCRPSDPKWASSTASSRPSGGLRSVLDPGGWRNLHGARTP